MCCILLFMYAIQCVVQGVAPQYAELMGAVSTGPKTLSERIADSPAFTKFLLRRDKEAAKTEIPASEVEAQVRFNA